MEELRAKRIMWQPLKESWMLQSTAQLWKKIKGKTVDETNESVYKILMKMRNEQRREMYKTEIHFTPNNQTGEIEENFQIKPVKNS